jgi:Rad3-related DNA helicase
MDCGFVVEALSSLTLKRVVDYVVVVSDSKLIDETLFELGVLLQNGKFICVDESHHLVEEALANGVQFWEEEPPRPVTPEERFSKQEEIRWSLKQLLPRPRAVPARHAVQSVADLADLLKRESQKKRGPFVGWFLFRSLLSNS